MADITKIPLEVLEARYHNCRTRTLMMATALAIGATVDRDRLDDYYATMAEIDEELARRLMSTKYKCVLGLQRPGCKRYATKSHGVARDTGDCASCYYGAPVIEATGWLDEELARRKEKQE